MLRLSVLLLVISLFAAVFGFGEIDGGVASVGKLLFFIFLALFVLSLVLGASIFNPGLSGTGISLLLPPRNTRKGVYPSNAYLLAFHRYKLDQQRFTRKVGYFSKWPH
jgi:uncharacterized membrane protein YtjA (UPF0391 family)